MPPPHARNTTGKHAFICTERQEGEAELAPPYNNVSHTFSSSSLQALVEGPQLTEMLNNSGWKKSVSRVLRGSENQTHRALNKGFYTIKKIF